MLASKTKDHLNAKMYSSSTIEKEMKKQERRGTLPEAKHEEHVTLNIETRTRSRNSPEGNERNILVSIK